MNENEQKAGSVADQKSKIRERYKGINPDELDVIPALPQEDIFAVENEQRVAVYARVSTDDPRQTSSYELQKNHYHDVISKSPNWKLVQIYADEGISGTSLQHRDQFKLMIEDCKKGQIDLIVTKSVSRFARNVVDCIGYVRELLALPHPVGVFFETERLNTFDGQGCEMKDKFRENFWIAFPAAVATLVIILVLSFQTEIQGHISQDYHLLQVLPYVLVLIGGIIGINVFVVLLTGIVSGAIIMLAGGHITPMELLTNMGAGVSGMFETCMVAILVAAMCALIREYGGFDALLNWIHKIFRGKKGGQLGMGLLVGTMDIATANNTVAIVMANPIAKEMAQEYGITPQKTASLLDTFSCIFQGIIPYGAQMLVAISAVNELGGELSAFQIIPKLFYPMFLLLASIITIIRSDS